MPALLSRMRLVLHAFGWRGLVRRLRYLAALRSGELRRRLPAQASFATSPPVVWRHRFDLDEVQERYRSLPDLQVLRERVVAETERMLAGELAFYGGDWQHVGWLPRWHVNPFTGHEYPLIHWTAISDDDPVAGDIKDVWELSRLPFTTTLARAYVLTHDDRYPESWWQAIEDWAEQNPPNTGVNWRCGQETSLRAIAMCFGLSVFGEHASTTPQRRDLAHRLLGASVARVQPTLGYALSQRNNHAISELVFLLTVLGPQRHLCRLLLEVLDDQFYPDGSYAQQSFTYQRLAVQTLQWLLVTRTDLPPGLRARVVEAVARSRDFLARCSDPVSGWLPNYGANDGARLFALDDAHYRDFRPLLASLGRTTEVPAPSETAIWLGLDELADRSTDAAQQPSTYVTLAGPRSLLLTRVGTNGHRPGHADQLAVDLWIDGHNVVADPGSYRYTAPAPWGNALQGLEVHATVRAVGETVTRLGRFLSAPVPEGQVVLRRALDDGEVVLASRETGHGALERAVLRLGDTYVIVDRVAGVNAVVRWNLKASEALEVHLAPRDAVRSLELDDADPATGWVSPLYGRREPCDARLVNLSDGGVAVTAFVAAGIGWLELGRIRAALALAFPGQVVDAAMAKLPLRGSS